METEDVVRVAVQPTRVGALGIGSFLLIAGGILCLLGCTTASTFMREPHRLNLQLALTLLYGTLILFLIYAKRRTPWEIPGDVVYDVDNLWLIHILVGATIVIGCVLGLLAVFRLDFCSSVNATEIETNYDRERRQRGTARKFLF